MPQKEHCTLLLNMDKANGLLPFFAKKQRRLLIIHTGFIIGEKVKTQFQSVETSPEKGGLITRRDRDEDSQLGGMAGWSQNERRDAGLSKPILDPLRRGGASFAYQSGVSIELIKALGDWRSDTIVIYLTMPLYINRSPSFS